MSASSSDPSRLIAEFSLPASTGQTLGLGSFKGKVPLVLVFLSDLSSNNDEELLDELNDCLAEFGAQRSQVLAVAKVTARHAREYADAKALNLAMLADASGAMAREYTADDGSDERRSFAIVADKEGRLVRRFDPLPLDVSAADAVEALLETVRAIGSGSLSPPSEEGEAN